MQKRSRLKNSQKKANLTLNVKAQATHDRGPNRQGSNRRGQSEQGQIRIIGGQWRGRKLPVLVSDGLRPSGDRVRETLFNWLQGDVRSARCLDAFAGSGALGFEALSRGAEHCTFLERAPAVHQQLSANATTLGLSSGSTKADSRANQRCQLVLTDTIEWLNVKPNVDFPPFDGVFLDPPFASGTENNTWMSCFESLVNHGWLSDEAWIYLEAPRDYQLPAILPIGWQLDRHKVSGAIQFCLFRGSKP